MAGEDEYEKLEAALDTAWPRYVTKTLANVQPAA
jgi:hypothetical protein